MRKLSHTHNNSRRVQKLTKRRLTIRITALCLPKVPSLHVLGLVCSQVQDMHSATISVDDNQLNCCCDQQAQLKQLRLVNLTENDAKAHFQAPC